MTDDYAAFRHIDSDSYDPDKPLDTILLRRMRGQVKSVDGFPDPCSFNERKEPNGDFAKLYAGAPRTAAYHVQRVPAGCEGVRVTPCFAAGPFEAATDAGRARLMVRINGSVFRSDWQTVATTDVDKVVPYNFEITGLSVLREALCEVAIVTQSFKRSTIESRNFIIRTNGTYQAINDSTEDPYGEDVAIESDVRPTADIIFVGNQTAINPYDPADDQVETGVYWITPTQPGGPVGGDIIRLFWLSIPYGYETRLIFSGDAPVTYHEVRPGIVPDSTRGPGKLQQAANDAAGKLITSSLGALYRDKPDATWARYPRLKHHLGDSAPAYLFDSHVARIDNENIRVLANLAMIGIKTDQTVDVTTLDELLEYATIETCAVTLRIDLPDGASSATADTDIEVTCFPYVSGAISPFLQEMGVGGSAGQKWTFREGQLWVGNTDNARGDLELITLQTVALDIGDVQASDLSLPSAQGYPVDVRFKDFPDNREIVVLNTSIQQKIVG